MIDAEVIEDSRDILQEKRENMEVSIILYPACGNFTNINRISIEHT